MEDGKITYRNRKWIRICNLAKWRKPPNLQDQDGGDSKPNDDDKKVDQSGDVPPSKRSKRLAGKQKVDYKLLNGV